MHHAQQGAPVAAVLVRANKVVFQRPFSSCAEIWRRWPGSPLHNALDMGMRTRTCKPAPGGAALAYALQDCRETGSRARVIGLKLGSRSQKCAHSCAAAGLTSSTGTPDTVHHCCPSSEGCPALGPSAGCGLGGPLGLGISAGSASATTGPRTSRSSRQSSMPMSLRAEHVLHSPLGWDTGT